MATITLHGNPIHTVGELPALGTPAPLFKLVKADLSEAGPSDFQGVKILNIFPSVDTGTCAASVRHFNQAAAGLDGVTVLCVSADLPFAQARFCGAEGLDKVVMLSTLRGARFGEDYGVRIADGPLAGLLARSVVVLDAANRVTYTQLVAETVDEPDYAPVLAAVKGR